jgi:hypothetical protein
MLWATVTAASPLTVTVDGSSTAVPAVHLAGYAPVAGDRVLCARVGTRLAVFGKFV